MVPFLRGQERQECVGESKKVSSTEVDYLVIQCSYSGRSADKLHYQTLTFRLQRLYEVEILLT